MSTVHTINSSLLFLTLILDEIKAIGALSTGTLSTIQQVSVTDGSLTTVWDPSKDTTVPDTSNYEWGSFVLTFTAAADISSLLEKYSASMIKVSDTDAQVSNIKSRAATASKATAAASKASVAAQATRANATRANATRRAAAITGVTRIRRNQYNKAAPNGIDPTNLYSGLGEPKKNTNGWRVNFIDSGPPAEFKRAKGSNAKTAVEAAKSSIDARRKQKLLNIVS